MLPNNYRTPEKPKFEALPEDIYQCAIEDINPEEQPKYNNPEEKEEVLNFKFCILDAEYAGRRIFKRVRPIVSAGSDKGQASWLYEIYKSAMKTEPTPAQFYGLSANELNNLIGRQVRINLKQSPPNKQGVVYNKIDGILSAKQELPMGKLEIKRPEIKSIDDEDIPVIEDEGHNRPTEEELSEAGL